jgi:arylsulfatase A-like enzyme
MKDLVSILTLSLFVVPFSAPAIAGGTSQPLTRGDCLEAGLKWDSNVMACIASKPNIVLIVADDLGYGDTGAYGASKIKTPNIDGLARDGVRLTDAHASPLCVPSRYQILSGTYYTRARDRIDRLPAWTLKLGEEEVTLPGLLKSAGYRTGVIGKWHLGFGRQATPDYNSALMPGPLEIGFDYYFGTPRTHNEPPFVFVENHRVVGLDPSDPIRIIEHNDVVKRGLKDYGWGISEGAAKAHAARPDDKIDLVLADKATEFIAEKSDSPFFLYLPLAAPHVPIDPSPEFRGTSQAGLYGDYVQQLDACVGKVLAALQVEGLVDNTLVIFTSDNGAVVYSDVLQAGHRSNGTLLGQKMDVWEGGHRVPFIARWPGRIPAGTVGDQLLGLTDLLATLAAAADIVVPDDAAFDSLNQLPVLTDPIHTPPIRTELLTEVVGSGCIALRQGDYVYVPKQGSCNSVPWSGSEPYSKLGFVNSDVDSAGQIKPNAPAVQLYNLATDPGERNNIAPTEPLRVGSMQKRLGELIDSISGNIHEDATSRTAEHQH